MATTRLYKTFTGVLLPNSPVTYGGVTLIGYLIDSGFPVGNNFPMQTEIANNPPLTTSGLTNDAIFIYNTIFTKETVIDGPIEGNIILQLASNVASPANVVLDRVTVELFYMYTSGITTSLTGAIEIFPNTEVPYTVTLTGSGTATRYTVGIFFSKSVSELVIPQNAMLAIWVRTYGHKSTSSQTLQICLQANRSAGDIKLAIPLVGI